MLKWVKRISVGIVAVILLVLLIGLSYEQLSRMHAARAFPPTGELIDVEGRKGHLYCMGDGSPTVILEAGLDLFGSLGWGAVQPDIAELTRVCSYDRAGIMWSESGPGPRDARRVADELHTLLEVSSISPPDVMAGHSLGGLYQRVYDARYPGEIQGFVFVDSPHPEMLERFPAEVVEMMRAYPPPPVLTKVLARLGVPRVTGQITGDALPEEGRAAARGFAPASIAGPIGEIEVIETTFSQARETGRLGSRPVVVLTAEFQDPMPGVELDSTVQRELEIITAELQEEIAALSSNSDRRVIENSAHFIQLEAPDAVISAIHVVVAAVREGGAIVVEDSVFIGTQEPPGVIDNATVLAGDARDP